MEQPNLHWSDVTIKAGIANIVDLEEQIMNKLSGCEKRTSHGSSMATPAMPKTPDNDADANSRQGSTNEKVVLLNPEECLLQYGPKTLNQLKAAIRSSFKVFWDGSISMFQETALSS